MLRRSPERSGFRASSTPTQCYSSATSDPAVRSTQSSWCSAMTTPIQALLYLRQARTLGANLRPRRPTPQLHPASVQTSQHLSQHRPRLKCSSSIRKARPRRSWRSLTSAFRTGCPTRSTLGCTSLRTRQVDHAPLRRLPKQVDPVPHREPRSRSSSLCIARPGSGSL